MIENSTDIRKALRAAILLQQPDEKQFDKGVKETLQLCRRKEPVLNFDAINQLQDSLKLLKLERDEGAKLWERAVVANPYDEDLITTWLNDAVSKSDWASAQKVSTTYPRNPLRLIRCLPIGDHGTPQSFP